MFSDITEIEKDIIKEILNIGLAKAADSFAIIARQNVYLNVPNIQVSVASEMSSVLSKSKPADTVVRSVIVGELNGKTYILFTDEQARKLAEICFGTEEEYQGNYNFIKRSLLLETSNILTASILTQIANILSKKIYGKIPTLVPYNRRRQQEEYLEGTQSSRQFVMTIVTKFMNSGTKIELPLMIVFDMESVNEIIKKVREDTVFDMRPKV